MCETCTVQFELFIPVVVDDSDPSTLFILCSPIQSRMCDVCHSFCMKFDMIVYYRIIGHVIHLQTFILLWLLIDIDVKFQFKKFLQVKSQGEK